MQQETLTNIGLTYGTNKATHHKYTEIYDKLFTHLRNEPIDFLELGVHMGASILMWQNYFTNARIIGVENVVRQFPTFNVGNSTVNILICDASKDVLLEKIFETHSDFAPSVVMDDASHASDDQIDSFNMLYPILKSGGIYVVEDTFVHHKNHYRYTGEGMNFGKYVNVLEWFKQHPTVTSEQISYYPSQKFPNHGPGLVVIKKP